MDTEALANAVRNGSLPDAELTRLLLCQPLALAICDAPDEGSLRNRLDSICTFLTPDVVALPVLSHQCLTMLHDGDSRPLTASGHRTRPVGLIAMVAAFLARCVLPRLVCLLPGASSGAPSLCANGVAYCLRYASECATDGGRVFRCHVDDSDFTLVLCIGIESGWTGADLLYVKGCHYGRPSTPESSEADCVRHKHKMGVGVLHTGNAYHCVEPLTDGERHSLVLAVMRNDAKWKQTFLSEGEGSLSVRVGTPRLQVVPS
mmetsp:Transcript_43951/g.91754  ORF Transcript_43951/g.91754 Transcript_43951/m.91754 type:complete len:261 (+) Transcript_43951:202-984(+)